MQISLIYTQTFDGTTNPEKWVNLNIKQCVQFKQHTTNVLQMHGMTVIMAVVNVSIKKLQPVHQKFE